VLSLSPRFPSWHLSPWSLGPWIFSALAVGLRLLWCGAAGARNSFVSQPLSQKSLCLIEKQGRVVQLLRGGSWINDPHTARAAMRILAWPSSGSIGPPGPRIPLHSAEAEAQPSARSSRSITRRRSSGPGSPLGCHSRQRCPRQLGLDSVSWAERGNRWACSMCLAWSPSSGCHGRQP
jgi:hypothetical protein